MQVWRQKCGISEQRWSFIELMKFMHIIRTGHTGRLQPCWCIHHVSCRLGRVINGSKRWRVWGGEAVGSRQMGGWLLCALSSLNVVTKFYYYFFLCHFWGAEQHICGIWIVKNSLVQFLQIPTKKVKYFSFLETTI